MDVLGLAGTATPSRVRWWRWSELRGPEWSPATTAGGGGFGWRSGSTQRRASEQLKRLGRLYAVRRVRWWHAREPMVAVATPATSYAAASSASRGSLLRSPKESGEGRDRSGSSQWPCRCAQMSSGKANGGESGRRSTAAERWSRARCARSRCFRLRPVARGGVADSGEGVWHGEAARGRRWPRVSAEAIHGGVGRGGSEWGRGREMARASQRSPWGCSYPPGGAATCCRAAREGGPGCGTRTR